MDVLTLTLDAIKLILEKYPYSGFEYWFVPIGDAEDNWDIYQAGKKYATMTRSEILARVDLSKDFIMFQNRPEYALVDNPYSRFAKYEMYIVGAYLMRAFRKSLQDPDKYVAHAWAPVEWIKISDFYRSPASTIYHESYEGGLLDHTLRVVERVLDLKKTESFKSVALDSAILCACMHDWCKIGLYESYMKNVKDDTTGTWSKQKAFKVTPIRYTSFGHGVSSMYLAQRFCKLDVDEALAIRWHMGMFNVANNEINEYEQSCEMYPIVLLLQFADHLSITKY